MIDFVRVGMRIADNRKRLGLSQEELADKLFVTRQALSKWENGMSIPSIDTVYALSRMFSISFEELLGLSGCEELVVSEDDIFRGHDRSYIISKIVAGKIKVKLEDVFYQMSPAERMYILRYIKEGKLETNLAELWVKLTASEQRYLGGLIK